MRRGWQCLIPGVLILAGLTACTGARVQVLETRGVTDLPAIPGDALLVDVEPFAPGEVALDGILDEWPRRPGEVIRQPGAETDRTMAWAGASPEALYFAFRVQDADYDPERVHWEMWKGDSIQIGLDPLLDRTVGAYNEDDSEIGLGETPDDTLQAGGAATKPDTVRWHAPQGLGRGHIPSDELALRRQGPVRIYEYRLPLSQLPALNPVLPGYAGFTFAVNDRDGSGTSDDAFTDRSSYALTAGMTDSKDPSRYAVLKFPVDALLEMQPVFATMHLETRVVMDDEPVRLVVRSYAKEPVEAELWVTLEPTGKRIKKRLTLPAGAAITELAVDTGAGKRLRLKAELHADGVAEPLTSLERMVYRYEREAEKQ